MILPIIYLQNTKLNKDELNSIFILISPFWAGQYQRGDTWEELLLKVAPPPAMQQKRHLSLGLSHSTLWNCVTQVPPRNTFTSRWWWGNFLVLSTTVWTIWTRGWGLEKLTKFRGIEIYSNILISFCSALFFLSPHPRTSSWISNTSLFEVNDWSDETDQNQLY